MYDLIVVGAGPAGSTAARTASIMGLNVLLLEKEAFPRYKPCGGALSDRAISFLDFPIPEEVCERSLNGARVHFQGKVVERRKGYRLTALVTRSSFDNLLLKKALEAGAELKTEKVVGIREGNDAVEVKTRSQNYESRFLVVASGCQDRLKEIVGSMEDRNNFGICVVADVAASEQEINRRLNNVMDIHFGVAAGGYGWIFPHRGYYSVGIGGLASKMDHPRQIMLDFLKANGFNGSYRLHGHTIPLGGLKRRIASKRVMLAGDAAGFVDAFTGEGIYYAMRSGAIAAKAAAERLSNPDLDLAREYESECKRGFGDELRYSLLLSKMMHSCPGIFFRILTGQEEILDRYVETATARTTYKNFIRWLFPRLPLCALKSL